MKANKLLFRKVLFICFNANLVLSYCEKKISIEAKKYYLILQNKFWMTYSKLFIFFSLWSLRAHIYCLLRNHKQFFFDNIQGMNLIELLSQIILPS